MWFCVLRSAPHNNKGNIITGRTSKFHDTENGRDDERDVFSAYSVRRIEIVSLTEFQCSNECVMYYS